jgi:hypothetical protein
MTFRKVGILIDQCDYKSNWPTNTMLTYLTSNFTGIYLTVYDIYGKNNL